MIKKYRKWCAGIAQPFGCILFVVTMTLATITFFPLLFMWTLDYLNGEL